MARKILFSLFFLSVLFNNIYAQQMLGIANSNYAGTNGIYMNPSSIADSRHEFFLNFFTIDGLATNNYLYYNGPFSISNMIVNGRDLKKSHGEEKLNGRSKLFNMGVDLRLPSFMLKLNSTHSIAFTSRSRTFFQGNNISEDAARLMKAGTYRRYLTSANPGAIIHVGSDANYLQNTLNSNSQFGVNFNSFVEMGLTYASVMINKEKNFLKGGFTVKRLSGIYSAHIMNHNADYEIKENKAGERLLQVQNLDMSYGFSQGDVNIQKSDIINAFTFRNTPGNGWGADLGFTYERRPDIDKYYYTMDGKKQLDNSKNKYKYRLGVALTDIGSISYHAEKTQSYNIKRDNIIINTKTLINGEIDNLDETMNEVLNVQPSEKKTFFKSSLPFALNINFDYKIKERLYINTTWVQNLKGKATIGMRQHSMLALTPRIEMKWLEIAFPLSLMNNYGDFAFGTMVKLGPIFIGSDNLAGALNWGKPFGADVYAGITLPIFKGKKKDKDKDGVSNKKDWCELVPGSWEFKGCPDSDGDGVQDSEDKCPTEAGLKEFLGCPDTDSDGIQDAQDECPIVAGLFRFKGCPDTDGDGVADKDDQCPNTHGHIDNDGCPLAELSKETFANLEFETGKSILTQKSLRSKNEIAQLMLKNKGYILHIEGHADGTGNATFNKKLSEERALEVKKYMVSQGVPANQIITKGFGTTRPIAPNNTAEGRKKNRRVELRLIRMD